MIKLPKEVLKEVAARAKATRLEAGLTQKSLATHSGVSLGSIKRFENTGQIAFISLLKIALSLNALDNFENLFKGNPSHAILSLDTMLKAVKKRKRGVK